MDYRLNCNIRRELNKKKYLSGNDAIGFGWKNVNKEDGSLEPCKWILSTYDDGKDDDDFATHRRYMYIGDITSSAMLCLPVEQMINNLINTGLKITFITGKFELSIFQDQDSSNIVVAIENNNCTQYDMMTFDTYEDAEQEYMDTLLTQLREEF